MVGLMLLALQVDLDTRLQRLATLHEAAKNSASAVAAEEPDPVLSALGEDGRNRLMWEYYKAYIRNRPKYGKPVAMSYKPGSYLQQLHAILVHHFAKPGSSPENARPLSHMKNPKALRDALCGWCVFWTQTRPPSFRYGPRADWTAEQWEALPMHSLPGEDVQRHPVYENDACRAEEAEEDGDSEDEQAVDGDEGTGEDARPVSKAGNGARVGRRGRVSLEWVGLACGRRCKQMYIQYTTATVRACAWFAQYTAPTLAETAAAAHRATASHFLCTGRPFLSGIVQPFLVCSRCWPNTSVPQRTQVHARSGACTTHTLVRKRT